MIEIEHFPCTVNLKTPGESRKQDKFIYTRKKYDSAMPDFRDELSSLEIQSHMNANLLPDTNIDKGVFG